MEEPDTTAEGKRKGSVKPGKRLLFLCAGGLVLIIGVLSLLRGSSRQEGESFAREANFPENTFRVLVVMDGNPESIPYGLAARRGAEAAAAKLNREGGIGSKQIAVRLVSTGDTDESAFDFSSELVRKTPVNMILDASGEIVSPGVLRAAHNAKTFAFIVRDGSCRTGPGMSEGKVSPYIWSLGLTREAAVEPFLTFLSDKRSKPESEFQVLFLSGETPLDQEAIELVKDTSESLGFKTVDSQVYDIRLKDYYTIARDILARVPDLVFVSNRLEPSKLFMEQAFKLALGRDMALAGFQVFDQDWRPSFGKNTDGVYTIAAYSPQIDSAENKEFLSTLSRPTKSGSQPKSPPVPTATTAAAWNALISMSHAVLSAKTTEPAAVSKKLESLELTLVNGRAFFDPKNHVVVQKMYGLRLKDGKYEIVENLGDAHHPEFIGCN